MTDRTLEIIMGEPCAESPEELSIKIDHYNHNLSLSLSPPWPPLLPRPAVRASRSYLSFRLGCFRRRVSGNWATGDRAPWHRGTSLRPHGYGDVAGKTRKTIAGWVCPKHPGPVVDDGVAGHYLSFRSTLFKCCRLWDTPKVSHT